MKTRDEIALDAARKIDDIFVRSHKSRAQRTSTVQRAVLDAIAAAEALPKTDGDRG
jgi:hypothetical protein